MHYPVYVCLLRSEACDSLQAREKVSEYLTEQGFDDERRFCGRCEYFQVGGRWSGDLTVLRLSYEQPKSLNRYWKRSEKITSAREAKRLFREMFPEQNCNPPNFRKSGLHYGEEDDAQVMDEPLFRQLRRGFSEYVIFGNKTPNVIFADDPSDDAWPKNAKEAEGWWVVVIDCHV